MRKEFPCLVSYNRFVELQQKAPISIVIFLKTFCLGQCTGISFVDLAPMKVCDIHREHSNKVFKELATKGQCSIGWFFGFRLHLIINDRGEILDFMLMGNVDDREPLKQNPFMTRSLENYPGDKGYICKILFEELFIDGIHLITKLRKNMKNCLVHVHYKILLKEKAFIESVKPKNICLIKHSSHRSFETFLTLFDFNTDIKALTLSPDKPRNM